MNYKLLPNYPDNIHVYAFDEGHFSIAENDLWLPGLYASELAAVYALYFDDKVLRKLWFPKFVGSGKYITVEDLNSIKKKKK